MSTDPIVVIAIHEAPGKRKFAAAIAHDAAELFADDASQVYSAAHQIFFTRVGIIWWNTVERAKHVAALLAEEASDLWPHVAIRTVLIEINEDERRIYPLSWKGNRVLVEMSRLAAAASQNPRHSSQNKSHHRTSHH